MENAPIQVGSVTLEGRWVRLEPLSQAHAVGLSEVSGDAEIWRWMMYELTSIERMRAWIDSFLEKQAAGSHLPFAIVQRESDKLVGSTSYLNIMPHDRGLEIGATWLSPGVWRTAVNTECKYLLLRHAFETLGCIRVQLKTDVRNERSRRAIERLGAQFEGVLRNHMVVRTGIRNSAMYSITDAEWPAVREKLEAGLAG